MSAAASQTIPGPLTRLLRRLGAAGAAAAIPADEVRARSPSIPIRRVQATDVGRGFADPRQREGTRRIAITLDDATFARVRALATAQHVSFAAAARLLIERGCTGPAEARYGAGVPVPDPPHEEE